MNYRLVTRSLGVLLLLLAAAMVVCLALAFWESPGAGAPGASVVRAWIQSLAITGGAGILLLLVGYQRKRHPMLRKEALAIVGIGWIISTGFAAIPYVLCEPALSPAQAYFESVSGLTTTGSTVINDLALHPGSILLWRSMTQWLGGMGILVMFVAVLSFLGASGKSLFRTESSAHSSQIAGTTITQTTRALWALYTLLTVVCGLGMWVLGMNPFQAVNHALATTSTGGFGTENASFNHPGFHITLKLWTTVFMFLCGGGFPLYIALWQKREWRILKEHEETWWYLGLTAGLAGAFVLNRASETGLDPWVEESVNTLFMTVSIMTTTGFVAGDFDTWPTLTKGGIVFLMLVGGCAGSTAGGLKVSRLILWWRITRAEVIRAFRPQQFMSTHLNGHKVPLGARGQVFVILTMAAVSVCAGTFLFCLLEPDHSFPGAGSAVISCMGNVGPAFLELGPTENFNELRAPTMLMLSLLMIMGRLEFVAIAALFSKRLWARY